MILARGHRIKFLPRDVFWHEVVVGRSRTNQEPVIAIASTRSPRLLKYIRQSALARTNPVLEKLADLALYVKPNCG